MLENPQTKMARNLKNQKNLKIQKESKLIFCFQKMIEK